MKPQNLQSNNNSVHKIKYFLNHEVHEAHEDFLYFIFNIIFFKRIEIFIESSYKLFFLRDLRVLHGK